MYIFHSIVQIKPGKEAEFEAFYYAGDPVEGFEGYLGRQLLKDKENIGRYFYVSIWKSFEALLACRAADSSKAKAKAMTESDVFAGPMDRVDCELCYDHRSGISSLSERPDS